MGPATTHSSQLSSNLSEAIGSRGLFPETSVPPTDRTVIEAYSALLKDVDQKTSLLSQSPDLNRGFEISEIRAAATTLILEDIYRRQSLITPSKGGVGLFLGGGIPRGECTRSSDADLWIAEEVENDPFTIELARTLNQLSTIFPNQISKPVINTVGELLNNPIVIGDNKSDKVIDIRKLFECIDYQQIGRPAGLINKVIDLFLDERLRRQDEVALYTLKSLRFRRNQYSEPPNHLDSFNIKEGIGGLRDVLFALHLISTTERCTCREARTGLPEIENNAINTILHVREWLAHQRDLKITDPLHLTFGRDLVPRFEAFFGRKADRDSAVHRLIEARIVVRRLCERIASEHLKRGIPSSRFSILVGLTTQPSSLGLAISPTSSRLKSEEALMELLHDATRHNLPVIADSTTLEVTAVTSQGLKPNKRFLDIISAQNSPLEAMQFLHSQGILDRVLPGFERLVSSFYPSNHRLTGENMADRALGRLQNLNHLYPTPESADIQDYYLRRFASLSQDERAALVIALLVEEVPLVSGDRHKQPERIWNEAIVNSVPEVIRQILEPYRKFAPERISEIEALTTDIVRQKFRLRELASEPLPPDKDYVESIRKEFQSKRVVTLLALFSYAAFDYRLPESHPHSRLNDLQWGRLTRLAELFEGFFDEQSTIQGSHFEHGSLEDSISKQLTLPILFLFAPKIRPAVKNISKLISSSSESLPVIEISSRDTDKNSNRDLSLNMDLFGFDRPGLIWQIVSKSNQLGLKVSDIQAVVLDIKHEEQDTRLVVDRFQIIIPRKLVDKFGKIGELEHQFKNLFLPTEEGQQVNLNEPDRVPISDIDAISVKKAISSKDRRVEISLQKHLLPDAIARFTWAISTQLNGDIKAITLDHRWKLSENGSLIATFVVPDQISDSDLQRRLFNMLAK
mgnify:CR=1 FL=1